MQIVRAILKDQHVRRFAVSFGTVFCLGGLAFGFFLKAPSTDALDKRSAVKPVDGKIAAVLDDEEAAPISTKDEQDRQRQTLQPGHYRVPAGQFRTSNDLSAEISDTSRANSLDQSSATQAVYTSSTSGGLASLANGGSFNVRNAFVPSEQQTSTTQASQTNASQMNDFPGANAPPTDKPLLGKMPRGYTYEQLLYRTWYGWGAYDWAQYQGQH